MMSSTWGMKSDFSILNRSTEALQAYMPAPVSEIISTNSGMEGMSSSSICFSIMWVMTELMPGKPPSQVATCRPGLPTVATLMCSWRLAWMASRPKKVKKRLASIPSARAPLAMIRPG